MKMYIHTGIKEKKLKLFRDLHEIAEAKIDPRKKSIREKDALEAEH